MLVCAVCGHSEFALTKVLWPKLISDWQLSQYEVDYINRQQGLQCETCGANLRSSVLATAITRSFNFNGTLLDFVRTPQAQALTVLEFNEAGTLHSVLTTLPLHEMMCYPEVDMKSIPRPSSVFDLIVHSDTLEHIDEPVAALSECRRVLKNSGVCCFTVPIVLGRLSRRRCNLHPSYHGCENLEKSDLLVHTEFGSDVWAYVLDAGFTNVTFECAELPAGLAISAQKSFFKEGTMTEELEFTGERYVSWLNSAEISFEHWHRYLLATSIVSGKTVLDIACGEGYGSHLLAGSAAKVIGIDIDPLTIGHAISHYSRPNLQFNEGSVTQIPIESDQSIDVVISYETIEHLNEQDQESFMRELVRVMKPDGVLLISTPNKRVYSDERNYKNEYHLKEFYERDFASFLGNYFVNTVFYGQKIYTGSYIWNLSSPSNSFAEFKLMRMDDVFRVSEDPLECFYFVALCSNGELPSLPSSFLADANQEIFRERDAQLTAHLLDVNQQVMELNQIIERRDQQLRELNEAIGERSLQIAQLNQIIAAKDREVMAKDNEIIVKDNEIAARDNNIKSLLASRSWRATAPVRKFTGALRKLIR